MGYPQVYRASLGEAEKRKGTELFYASHKLNIACRQAVETAIRNNFGGKRPQGHGGQKPLVRGQLSTPPVSGAGPAGRKTDRG